MSHFKAGATIQPNLHLAHIILGIKETPLNELITSPVANLDKSNPTVTCARTHMMFSHTAKGQAYNIPLLSRFLADETHLLGDESLPRLVDYEFLTDKSGKRTVGFGWFAGS